MPERRANTRRGRLHGADARHDLDCKVAPCCLATLYRLEDSGRHGENAGIAAGDDRDHVSGGSERKRMARPLDLDTIVARVPCLSGTQRDTIEIGSVTDKIARFAQHVRGLRGQPVGIARPEPHDIKPAAHGRRPRPGTQIKEK